MLFVLSKAHEVQLVPVIEQVWQKTVASQATQLNPLV